METKVQLKTKGNVQLYYSTLSTASTFWSALFAKEIIWNHFFVLSVYGQWVAKLV